MKQPTTILSALVALTLLAPLAGASHDDPTHGTVPHTVADSPLDVHPVDVSTPHPYELDEVYAYEITVDGVDSLSVHFENYDVNGYYNSWRGECNGSELVIVDGNTGLELDTFCGAGDADWWTPAYETDSVVLRLETAFGGWGSDLYGFDVYEVATNGAEPVVGVPRVETLDANVNPRATAAVDPEDPESLESTVRLDADADTGAVYVDHSASFLYGSFWECGMTCVKVDGFSLEQTLEAGALGEEFHLKVTLVGSENPNDPTGYDLQGPTVECEHGQESC